MGATPIDGSKLNLGGGANWSSPGWTNLDIDLGFDLRLTSLPASDESVAIIYCSHVLEHMPVEDARRVITDCHRTLKPGGLLRLVLPDCQKFAEAWLAGKDEMLTGNKYISRHFPDLTSCFREMGGNAHGLNQPSALQHYFFWDHWSLTWLLVLCGFKQVSLSRFGESQLDELRKIATMNDCEMPISGFDNPYTEAISAYVEAVKG